MNPRSRDDIEARLSWLAPYVSGRILLLGRTDRFREVLEELEAHVCFRAPGRSEELPEADVVVLDGMLGWHAAFPSLPKGVVVLAIEPHGHRRRDAWRPVDVRTAVEVMVKAGLRVDELELDDHGTLRAVAHDGEAGISPDLLNAAIDREVELLLSDQEMGLAARHELEDLRVSTAAHRAYARARQKRLEQALARTHASGPDARAVRDLRRKLDRAEARATKYEAQIAQLRQKISRMEQRRWWRLGLLLSGIRRSPRQLSEFLVEALRLVWPRAVRSREASRDDGHSDTYKGVSSSTDGGKAPHAGSDAHLRVESMVPSHPIGLVVSPPVIFKELPPDPRPTRADVKFAAILDAFSEASFSHEVSLLQLDRVDWREELEHFAPDLLLVESAWHGKERQWVKAVGSETGPADDLRELVGRCKAAGIPTVFWNKEDPPNFDRFAATATLFDWVYTVDEDCVDRYASTLPRDRIGVLPFAAQSAIHHPRQVRGGREYDVAFAGSYFPVKHRIRREQMDVVLRPALEFGLHIFSRFEADPRYRFPEPFSQHVVGSLEYEDMVTAYKRYRLFLNVNSVVASRTTCSRRIFELAGSGTPVLSGQSPAIDHMLGSGIVEQASTRAETESALTALLSNQELLDRASVKGIRAVHARHTYRHRVDRILSDVGIGSPLQSQSRVSVIAPTMRPQNLPALAANLRRQTLEDVQLVLVTHGFETAASDVEPMLEGSSVADLVVMSAPSHLTLGEIMNRGLRACDGALITKMDDDDYYAPNYLWDQSNAFAFADAEIVGKRSLYAYLEALDTTVLRWPGMEHQYVSFVAGPTMMATRAAWEQLRFPEDTRRGMDTEVQRRAVEQGMRIYATDRFNFILRRHKDVAGHTWDVHHNELLAEGRIAYYGWNSRNVEV